MADEARSRLGRGLASLIGDVGGEAAHLDRPRAQRKVPIEFLNPNLSIHGIVLTMFDSRNNLSNQVVADVRQFMGSKVYNTMIPRNVRISEAPSYGKPVLVYDLKCVGSDAYLKLATEVIQRERELRTH